MKISIVTTCLNGAATIRETIESILSQEGAFDIEHIIVDAGSTDDTLKIAREYGDRIKIESHPRCSQSEGINIGLKAATGDILAFLNADDIYLPGTFQKVARAFSENPEALWAAGQCLIIDGAGKVRDSWIASYKNFCLRHYYYFWLLVENFICQPAVFFKPAALKKYGYFSPDEHLAMDYDYWLRMGAGEKPVIINEPLAGFRRTETTKSNMRFRQQFKDDMRLACRYAVKSRKFIAIPLKVLSYWKTIAVYSMLYR